MWQSLKTNISINEDIMQGQCQILKKINLSGLYNFPAMVSSFSFLMFSEWCRIGD